MAENAEAEVTEEEPKKKGKGLLIIIAVVTMLVLGGGGAALYFLVLSEPAVAEEAAPEEPEEPEQYIVNFDTFVVNLADPGGRRYLKLTLRAITTDGSLQEALSEDDILRSKMRDRILSILASKTLEDVASPIGKDGLRRQLQRELNGLLEDPSVSELLFVEFVIQ